MNYRYHPDILRGSGGYLKVRLFIIPILVAALLLCMCACGGGGGEESTSDPFGYGENGYEPPVPTGTPDGEPVTEDFMTDADYSDVLERFYSTKWKLKQGDYYDKTIDPIVNGKPNPVSTAEFRRDMTCHFTFSDGCYSPVDTDAYYNFSDNHAITVLLPDIVLPVICVSEEYVETSVAFAFDAQGRLWALFQPRYPLQNYFIGLYEPA